MRVMASSSPTSAWVETQDGIVTLIRSENAMFTETMAACDSAAPSPHGAEASTATAQEQDATRYVFRGVLGKGGMGDVYLYYDERIGREVAVKMIRESKACRLDLRQRFIREARVQGRLEHPSIVPVHDVGVDASGRSYFTMKRLNGLTLEEILDGLRAKDHALNATYSRRRLLTALSNVCLAVAFAHSRGVVHRDLKPANIMLGEFGEVYVLDWGLARVSEWSNVPLAALDLGLNVTTQPGMLLGTPGYIAPEQVRGEIEKIDARTDVYALGAILFEVLTLEPLHPGTTLPDVLGSTLFGGCVRASERTPERNISPELDEICARATARKSSDRFQSVRQLHDALERYLDGQRDRELRHQLAQRHTLDAQVALALASRGGPDSETLRRKALRALTTAIALDSTHEGAVATLMRALADPVADLSPDAEAEITKSERHETSARIQAAAPRFWWMLAGSCVAIDLLAFLYGSLVVVPGIAMACALAIMICLRADRAQRTAITGIAVATVVLPLLLQLAGVLPLPYVLRDGVFEITSMRLPVRPELILTFLVVGTISTMIAAGAIVGRAVDALKSAERSRFVQAWRLRELLPEKR